MDRHNYLVRAFQLLILTLSVSISASSQSLTVRQIMAEPSLAGQRVEGEKLSPNGESVVFLWNAEGKPRRDLYIVPASGGTPTVILRTTDLPTPTRTPERPNPLNYGVEVRDQFVRDRENALGGFEWSPDSTRLVFTYSGDVFVMTLADRSIKRYTRTQSPEFGARFLDNDRIAFSQGGNAYVLDTRTAQLTQLTRESNPQQFITVGQLVASKDGKMAAYVVTDSSKQRQLIVPNFIPEFVTGGGPRRGWTEQKLMFTPTDGSRDTPHEIKLPKPEGVSSFRRMVWTADNRSLIVDRLDKDTKRRQLFYVRNVGANDERIFLITEETDEKWQAPLSAIFEPHPTDKDLLFFASEKEGFSHLYQAKLDWPQIQPVPGESPAATAANMPGPRISIDRLTRGDWQVEWAKWTAEGDQIVFMSTEAGYTERRFFALFPATGDKVVIPSNDKGMATTPQLDDQNEQPTLLFGFSQWNKPEDLYAQKVCTKCRGLNFPVQLTRTTPESFSKIDWTVPKFIEVNSRDGKKIPAKIYLPPGHTAVPKTKYPMVIFVHGAGYLQNVINGWNNYYREFMFNDMFAKKGYVVLDIDFRGSAGYGRDWRTDVYDFLGGKDFDDHIDSIDHMVKNYGVDQNRIGVYGGSYGGFMAGMLVMRAPERIAAAAALRSVFDWKNYYAANPFYTAQRLGMPDKNPEAYKRSSPITYADKLERPLLILHGMVDDNVHVQDSVQLIEKLIRLEKTKYFEAMLYPTENHGFVRPESWADEYERIQWFFEKHLAPTTPARR